MPTEKYLRQKDSIGKEFITVSLIGTDLLNDPILNKGTGFSKEERKSFHLVGLIPPNLQTFEEQLNRVYQGYQGASTDIEKYIFLRSLQDRNETLFYALVSMHIEEMTPIIYTPTVGRACQEFSHRYQKARGLYITPENVRYMSEMKSNLLSDDIKIIVVTDSQGVLGIGDQGVGGMGISIGKLSLYTLGAGIHPAHCLPIAIDIGTDNEGLLKDPMYLGSPHKRITGIEYDNFIDEFVKQVKLCFPEAILQWEDFSKSNAFNNLEKYVKYLPSFNDDIQGTGSVVLSGIIGATKIKKETLNDQIYIIYGAGAGGVGVADQIYDGLLREGVDSLSARNKIFLLDSRGVVFDDRKGLDEYKQRYAKPKSLAHSWVTEESGKYGLTDIINNIPVTVLIGTCGIGGSFKEKHVKQMLKYSDRPMVFPLSNPTSNCEAIPTDIYKWSNGKAIVATGSPFENIEHCGKNFRVGQGNNVFIFPGVGLATIVGEIKEVTLDMFTTASYALADCVTDSDLAEGAVYPRISDLKKVSLYVTSEVLKRVIQNDPTHPLHNKEDIKSYIEECMWEAAYVPYKKI